MSKYKYYFRKPKSEIVKDILSWLVMTGVIYVAATSPYFILNIIRSFKKGRRYNKKKVYGPVNKLLIQNSELKIEI